jgi:hypothetical protein
MLNFLILIVVYIKDFLGIFIFRPPNPPGYRIQMRQVDEEIKEVLNYI